jgi:DNA primase
MKEKEKISLRETPDVHIKVNGLVSRLEENSINYILSRGISLDVARKMNMRYLESGTINNTPFNKRLLIPVIENRRVISYEGRDTTGQSPKKVLYPSGSSVNTLFDIDNLDRTKPLYIVEGIMDLAVLRQSEEFSNSTSIFGSSMTKRKALLLSEFKKLVFIPDNDTPGYQCVVNYKKELPMFTEVKVLPVPQFSKDVGDLPKHNFSILNKADQWLSNLMTYNDFVTNLT